MAELTPYVRAAVDPRIEHLTDGRLVVVTRPGVSYIFDTEAEAERFLVYVDERRPRT